MSRDGAKWESLGETTLSTDGAIKVGLAAVNGSDVAFTPEFSEVRFFEAKK